jgi:hypothetical protein
MSQRAPNNARSNVVTSSAMRKEESFTDTGVVNGVVAAKRRKRRSGARHHMVITDGPFAESKEMFGGSRSMLQETLIG